MGRASRCDKNSWKPVGVIILIRWSFVAVWITCIARSILVGSTLSSSSGWIFDWISWVFIVWWSALKSLALMFRVRSGSYKLLVWFLRGWCWSWLVLASLLGVTVCCWVLVWVLLFSSVIGWCSWVLKGLVVSGRMGYGSGLNMKGMGVGLFCVIWLLSGCVSCSSKWVWLLVLLDLLILFGGGML